MITLKAGLRSSFFLLGPNHRFMLCCLMCYESYWKMAFTFSVLMLCCIPIVVRLNEVEETQAKARTDANTPNCMQSLASGGGQTLQANLGLDEPLLQQIACRVWSPAEAKLCNQIGASQANCEFVLISTWTSYVCHICLGWGAAGGGHPNK